jgi:hypothetical protein
MSSFTAAGAIIGITATKPATFDAAGYGANTYTTIGEITGIGDFGREYEEVTHKPLASRGTVKKKGGYDEGKQTLNMACDEKDAGQLLLQAACLSDADYYFKIARQDGTVHYVPAQVMTFKRGGLDDRNKIVSVSTDLNITSVGAAGVGVITVPAT